jgi:N-acyl-L-homoserine lactone synthetase
MRWCLFPTLLAISPDQKDIFLHELDEYYVLRKRVLIDQRGWGLKAHKGRERDPFDHDQAHYLLYIVKNKVWAGVRLMPTTGPNLTMDVFAHLIEASCNFHATVNVWEVSRFVTESGGGCPHGLIRKATFMLFMGVIEYGILHNLHSILATTDIRLERILRMCQWELKRLGGLEKIGNTFVVSGLLEISERIRHKVYQNTGMSPIVFCREALQNKCLLSLAPFKEEGVN